MMREHTEATLAYLKTVKRKLHHSGGLDVWTLSPTLKRPSWKSFTPRLCHWSRSKSFNTRVNSAIRR
ncbi:MAG: hypothetical protein FJ244_06395 [Nitrospira sp.]|nr:hypothetical protein [Nitrospira sp.]